MRWRWMLLGAAGLAAFVAVLLLTAPALLYERLMAEQAGVRLAGCSGTVWRGECRVMVAAPAGWRDAGATSHAWRFDAAGGLRIELGRGNRPAGAIHPSLDGWRVTGADFHLPLALGGLLPDKVAAALRPVGRMRLTAEALACDWSGSGCRGKARVEVFDLILAGRVAVPLGDYKVDIEFAPGGRVGGTLTTVAGPLNLGGRFERVAGGGLQASVRAVPAPGASEGLRRLLGEWGRPDGPDGYLFAYRS